MRKPKYHTYLNQEEYRQIMSALILKKNQLIETGHYTDAIDDVLIKLRRAKVKNVEVVYIG